MRSDKTLDQNLVNNRQWYEDSITGKKGRELQRIKMPSKERAKLSFSGKERNRLFVNENGTGFEDVSPVSGIDSVSDSRSFAIWDFDRDGWQDIVLANTNSPVLSVFKNQVKDTLDSQRSFVAFRFVGGNDSGKPSDTFSNRDAIGVKVRLIFDDQVIVGEKRCGEGLAAQNSGVLLFGIGKQRQVPKAEVIWPSGKHQWIETIEAEKLVTVFENPEQASDPSGVEFSEYVVRTPQRNLMLENERFRFDKSESRIRVFVSMATWCQNCKKHLPQLRILKETFDQQDLELTAIAIDPQDSESKLLEYQEKYKPAYQLIEPWDANMVKRFNNTVRQNLNLDLLPAAVVTNGEGEVLKVFPNVPTVSDLKKTLKAIQNNP